MEGSVRTALESYFLKCPKPNTLEITHISDDLGLERDVCEPGVCQTLCLSSGFVCAPFVTWFVFFIGGARVVL